MATTPVTRSGCSSAICPTTIEPQSWPTNTAFSTPTSSSSAEQVVGEVVDVVVLDRLGPIGLAVAALVRSQHVVAGVGQRGDLVAPRVGQLGEAVAEHHGRAVVGTGLHEVELDAVGRHPALHGRWVGGGHAASLARAGRR